MKTRDVYILGGGTVSHIRPHFAVTAPAYGTTAREIFAEFFKQAPTYNESRERENVVRSVFVKDTLIRIHLVLSKMADHTSALQTNEDVSAVVDAILANPNTAVVINNMALSDYEGEVLDDDGNATPSGKDQPRLQSRDGSFLVRFRPAPKIIERIKDARPDIVLVGFKTTAGDDYETMLDKAERQIRSAESDYVFCNDVHTRKNILVSATTVGVRRTFSADRDLVIKGLVSHLIDRVSS